MPFYFGYKPDAKQKASSLLNTIGVNLIQAAPFAIKAYVFPDVQTISYLIYVAIFERLVLASISSSPTILSKTMGGIIPKITNVLPFTLPCLAISFTQITDERSQMLLQLGFYSTIIQEQSLFVCEKPTLEILRTVSALPGVLRKCRVPNGMTNLDSMGVAISLIKLASILSYNSTRAQFMTDEEVNMAIDSPAPDPKRKAVASSSSDESSASKKSGRWAITDYLLDLPSHLLGLYTEPTRIAATSYSGPKFQDANKLITDAKMTSTRTKKGMTFPFVAALSLPDDQVPDFIASKFSLLFGQSVSERVKNLETLRSAWGVIKNTTLGHELAHFFAVFRISMEAGTTMRPSFSGQYYDGAYITGTGFTVSLRESIYTPSEPATFEDEKNRLSVHSLILNNIDELCVANGGGSVKSASTMMEVHASILKASLSSVELEVIRAKAHHLRFKQKSRPTTSQNLIQTFRVLSGAEELPAEYPIGGEALGERDLVTVALSGYGRSVPSLRTPGGTPLNFAKEAPVEKFTMEASKSRKGSTYKKVTNSTEMGLSVRLVNLTTAKADWKTMLETGIALSGQPTTGKRAGPFVKCFKGTERGAIWEAAMQCIRIRGSAPKGTDSSVSFMPEVQDIVPVASGTASNMFDI